MCPQSINMMKFSVKCLFWPFTNNSFFLLEPAFPLSHTGTPGFMSVFPVLLLSLSLPCISFHPSCVAMFLLPSNSISVLISLLLIPLSPPMPVSYLTVRGSVFTRPLVLSVFFSFLASSCNFVDISCLSPSFFRSPIMWLVALPSPCWENVILKQLMCPLMDGADECCWECCKWSERSNRTYYISWNTPLDTDSTGDRILTFLNDCLTIVKKKTWPESDLLKKQIQLICPLLVSRLPLSLLLPEMFLRSLHTSLNVNKPYEQATL